MVTSIPLEYCYHCLFLFYILETKTKINIKLFFCLFDILKFICIFAYDNRRINSLAD